MPGVHVSKCTFDTSTLIQHIIRTRENCTKAPLHFPKHDVYTVWVEKGRNLSRATEDIQFHVIHTNSQSVSLLRATLLRPVCCHIYKCMIITLSCFFSFHFCLGNDPFTPTVFIYYQFYTWRTRPTQTHSFLLSLSCSEYPQIWPSPWSTFLSSYPLTEHTQCFSFHSAKRLLRQMDWKISYFTFTSPPQLPHHYTSPQHNVSTVPVREKNLQCIYVINWIFYKRIYCILSSFAFLITDYQ